MAYSPHTWHPGEIISSARLNALEQGVAAGGGGGSAQPLICNLVEETLDTTFGTVYDAFFSGVPVFIRSHYSEYEDLEDPQLCHSAQIYEVSLKCQYGLEPSDNLYYGEIDSRTGIMSTGTHATKEGVFADYPYIAD